jgi:predicted SAM-dependent methyltransferase
MIISRNQSRDISQFTKLNIGCGGDFKENYINVDLYDLKVCDIQDNIITLEKFPDNFATEIFHQHVMEHINYDEGHEAVKAWYRVLAPGGKLIFETPDAEETFRMFLEMDYHERWEQTHNLWQGYKMQIWGTQDALGMQHYILYDKEKMFRMLQDVGFINISVENINDPWLKENMHVVAYK